MTSDVAEFFAVDYLNNLAGKHLQSLEDIVARIERDPAKPVTVLIGRWAVTWDLYELKILDRRTLKPLPPSGTLDHLMRETTLMLRAHDVERFGT